MKKQYFKNFRKEGLPGGPNELIINSEGFILSENGQWEFPGLPTVIPSSDITMEDVPYPVLGISDTGDTQMMYPEEDYQFDGDIVYELPMAQNGGITLPEDYNQFLEYNKTAPENRQPDNNWQYGNPRQYDHYGMWDALGKPTNFKDALKNNPDWQPDEYDNMYHGFSTNPNTGVWLKPHIAGESEPGSTAWMEAKAFYLSGDKNWNSNNFSLQYDPEIQRMRYVPKKQKGGWLDSLPKAQPGGTREPIYVDPNDLLGMQRYNAYNDSLNLYKAYRMQDKLMGPGSRVVHSEVIPGEWSIRELLDNRKKKYNSHLRGFFAKDWQSEEDMRRAIPIGDEQNSFDLIKYYKSLGFTDKDIMYHTSPDIVSDKIRPIGTYMDGSFNSPIYKKPVQPYAIRKTEPRTPYSPVQTNPNSTVQLPINNIPLQQIPTIGIGEPTFEGNNAYWKKQDNQLIYQNNDYSNNRNLPISNKPGDRFHQEPSWMVGDDRYYERDGEAYLVPQPKGGWKNKQILDPSSGKWKSKIVKKANGDWLDELQDGGSAKLLNRSRKEIIKQRELEENLRKEGFNEDGVFTRVLPEYTVKSPEKKLYDEAFQDVLNKQKSFQNKWYPGDISEGVLDNMKQRANVIASDKVAKNILENNKVKDLKDYQKEYIANSNYSGKLRPGIFKEFTEGVQDLGRITQGKLPTTKALGILSPLEYPVNLVRGTVKGEGLDALKGKISSPWIDASKVDIGAVNDVGAYNTIYNIGLDPLNLTGIGLTGAADDVLKGISKGSKYFKTNKIVNTPKQLPNPSLGEPLGTVEDVANRSAIQYAGSEPYLFNPETNTWEILRNEINDKYRQGYTDIPQFNEQLKEIKATTEFGKRPLLNKADFVNPNQAVIDMLFNKHTTYKDYIPEINFKALEKEAEEMGIPMDNLLERTLEKLAYKSNRDPLTSKPFYFNAENPRVGNRALLYSNPDYFKMFGKELNEIGPLGGKTTSEIPRYYQDQINRYTDMLEIATESQKISIQNKIVELYKKGLNQTIDKNAKPFTGKDAFQYIQPNKLGGQKKGWLNNIPKAQKGNTGKQSANESWGLTQESQLSDLTKGLLNNILHRQAFAESSFNPKVISGDKTSRVGALGMTQIMPETLNEYINKTGDKNINILDPKDAVKVQKWYMQDLLNADFIHKPNQSEKVRMVKALGSYNWGRGNMSKFLGKQKKKGVDIYSDELSWVNDLPVETRDYVNKIVLGTNEKFNQEYKQNSSKYKDYYQKGGWLDKL